MSFFLCVTYILLGDSMFKDYGKKKIMVATSAVLILLIMYIMPSNVKEVDIDKSSIEYTYDNIVSTVYLVDSDDYVARTSISSCNCDGEEKVKDLVEGLIIDGKKMDVIPNGFRSIIPSGTSILDLSLEDKTLTINFSKELLEVNDKDESKMIEAIIYTLTSIDGIDNVKILVEGSPLDKLPSGTKLPTLLNRDYGINKNYDLASTKDINYYTLYYVNKNNDYEYYVPVTKYVNNEEDDKIKIIIKELSSSPIYETNLMSFLNANTEVYDYELLDNNLKLNFNNLLLSDNDSNKILEEVMYTIGLSMDNIYNDLESVSFYVNDEEVYTLNISDIK